MAGVFVLVWTCSACSFLESTRIVSCAWVRLWDNVILVLVSFAISSVSSIASHASAYSTSTVLTWAYVSCVWFTEAPYPIPMGRRCWFLADLVAPVGLCKIFLDGLPGFQSNLHVFSLFIGFLHPSCPEDHQVSDVIGVLDASANSNTSSICSKRSTIGSRSDHPWFIFCSLSSISMVDMVPW